MPVLTRYQEKAHLYETVLEQPLILENILSHLEARDLANLKLLGGPLMKEPRYQSVLNEFLETEYICYEEKRRRNEFIKQTQTLLDNSQQSDDTQQQIRLVNEMFDYLDDNKDILKLPEFEPLDKCVERKLIELMFEHDDYCHYALYYLNRLFDIHVKMSNDPDTGDLIQYIETRGGILEI